MHKLRDLMSCSISHNHKQVELDLFIAVAPAVRVTRDLWVEPLGHDRCLRAAAWCGHAPLTLNANVEQFDLFENCVGR